MLTPQADQIKVFSGMLNFQPEVDRVVVLMKDSLGPIAAGCSATSSSAILVLETASRHGNPPLLVA